MVPRRFGEAARQRFAETSRKCFTGAAVTFLFGKRRFTGLGPASFAPAGEILPLTLLGRRRGLRAAVRQSCPRLPGIYGMLDPRGELIYLGKAKSLRARLLSYFHPASRDAKAGRILSRTQALIWEVAPSEFAALLRELELIRRWQPCFNVQGQPHRQRRTYLCLGRRPAPYLFLARRPPAATLLCYGPVLAGRRARQAVRHLNDLFQLRDCPRAQRMVFADEAELFPLERAAGCLRYEIGTCLGPCAAACTRTAYAAQVHAVAALLDNSDCSLLESLRTAMLAASAGQQFERAAVLRDKLASLTWVLRQCQGLRQARVNHSFVYPVTGHDGTELWYLIEAGTVRMVVRPPTDRQTWLALANKISGMPPTEVGTAVPPAEIDQVLLIASWFRRRPEERQRAWEWAAFLDRCRKEAAVREA